MPSNRSLSPNSVEASRTLYYTDVSVKPNADMKKFEKVRFKKNEAYPQTLMGRLQLMHYHYRLLTGTDMLDPWERVVFSKWCQFISF